MPGGWVRWAYDLNSINRSALLLSVALTDSDLTETCSSALS
jgi:hypothetical protein